MSQDIIDLDDALPPPIRVKLGGEVYRVPGDIPAPLFVRIKQLAREYDDPEVEPSEEAMEDLYDELLALFRVHQPELETLPVGLTQMVIAVGKIYGGAVAEDPPPNRAARRASARSTKSSSRPKPTPSA